MSLEILKTYKLYIGGKFPRTESGRYYSPTVTKGKETVSLGNICQSSRKDLRNAVVAARGAQAGWEKASPFLRSQILYRLGEMIQGRTAQFEAELVQQGAPPAAAKKEVATAIDLCIYYAGWCDKYQQVFSSVNPVSSAHFNFSAYEAIGVTVAIAPNDAPLAGLLGTILPLIAGGNSVVVLAAEEAPLSAITLAEALATSDLPGGTVNILTGFRKELLPTMGTHMDINAVIQHDLDAEEVAQLKKDSVTNLKRIITRKIHPAEEQDAYPILDTLELKTTWHPIEAPIAGGAKY